MGDASSAGVIADLMEHPAHFVRWTAVRAAIELDEGVGLALLERASRDEHPHVRNAAARALAEIAISSPPEHGGEKSDGTDH